MKKHFLILILSFFISQPVFAKEKPVPMDHSFYAKDKEDTKKKNEEKKYLTKDELIAINNYIGKLPTDYGYELRAFFNSKLNEK